MLVNDNDFKIYFSNVPNNDLSQAEIIFIGEDDHHDKEFQEKYGALINQINQSFNPKVLLECAPLEQRTIEEYRDDSKIDDAVAFGGWENRKNSEVLIDGKPYSAAKYMEMSLKQKELASRISYLKAIEEVFVGSTDINSTSDVISRLSNPQTMQWAKEFFQSEASDLRNEETDNIPTLHNICKEELQNAEKKNDKYNRITSTYLHTTFATRQHNMLEATNYWSELPHQPVIVVCGSYHINPADPPRDPVHTEEDQKWKNEFDAILKKKRVIILLPR